VIVDHPLGELLDVVGLRLLLGELTGADLEQAALRGLVDELPILLGQRGPLGVRLRALLRRLALTRLALSSLTLTRLALSSLTLTRLALTRLALSSLALSRLTLSRLTVSGVALSGLALKVPSRGRSPRIRGLGERLGRRQAHRGEDSSE